MKRMHYAPRLIRRQAVRAGSWKRPYAGVRCMVSAQKGPNHARDVVFTFLCILCGPNHPRIINSTMIREGEKYSTAVCRIKCCKDLHSAIYHRLRRDGGDRAGRMQQGENTSYEGGSAWARKKTSRKHMQRKNRSIP